jgi:hypothetical protein
MRMRIRSWMTSIQPGTIRSPKVSRATMNGVISRDFWRTSMTSYCETWNDGMSTFLPLTRKWPWLTS